MKATILSGLIAVALGGLTSCRNILEENGMINNVAESGMGELRINLSTDPTVEAITKAEEDLSKFTVKIDNTEHSYDDWKDNKRLTVAVGNNKTVEAYNIKADEVKNFAWNKPYYTGSQTANIVAGQITTVNISCSRANSTLVVDTTGFNPEEEGQTKILCVKSLKAYAEEQDNSDTNGFDLLKRTNEADSVCVKADIKARIELVPAKMADGTELSPVTTYIFSDQSAEEKTEAAKRYKVSYTVNNTNGQATITVKVNNTVTEVPIGVEVNPYGSTTQENQSTDGDGE